MGKSSIHTDNLGTQQHIALKVLFNSEQALNIHFDGVFKSMLANGLMYPDRIFQLHPKEKKLHFLSNVDDPSEQQQQRLKKYREDVAPSYSQGGL